MCRDRCCTHRGRGGCRGGMPSRAIVERRGSPLQGELRMPLRTMRTMRESERRARLVEHLRVDGRASVAQLASSLDVTPSTIRRDLQRLARDGRLVRTYGGAALNDGLSRAARAA